MIMCPKCAMSSGNDWSQCQGSCPMPGSPYYVAPRLCADCEYEITEYSPRSTLREPRPLIRFKPRDALDPETLAVLDSAFQARVECSTWPSWKHGRCNCPVAPTTPEQGLVEVVWDPYRGGAVMSLVEISLAQHAEQLSHVEWCATEEGLRDCAIAHALTRWPREREPLVDVGDVSIPY